MSGNDGVFGGITQIDELLEQQNNILRELTHQSGGSSQGTSSSTGGIIPRKKRVIDFTSIVPANDTTEDEEAMPFNGFVDGVIAGWPDGADTFVGTKLVGDDSGEVYYPGGEDEWAAYNDFTYLFPVSFSVREGDDIKAMFQNNKSVDIPINLTVQVFEKFSHEEMSEIERRLG